MVVQSDDSWQGNVEKPMDPDWLMTYIGTYICTYVSAISEASQLKAMGR